MGNIKQGPNDYEVLNNTTLADIPNIASIASRIYKKFVGIGPKSFNPTVNPNLNTLKVVVAGDIVQINAMIEADLPMFGQANVVTTGSGSAGPLVTIPVALNQKAFTINGVQFDANTKLFRSDTEYPKTNWSYVNSGGNVTVTFASGQPGISQAEADNQPSLQYQLNS